MAASGISAGRGARSVAGNVMGAAALAVADSKQDRVGPSNKNVRATRSLMDHPKATIKSLTGALSGPDKGAGSA